MISETALSGFKDVDVDVVDEPVNHSRSQLVVAKDHLSLGEPQVGGNDEALLLIAAGDDLEQELAGFLWRVMKPISSSTKSSHFCRKVM